ncbi:hypothetical protein [Endozoicomonas sp. ONNA1]|uniref:hypothetical protein n=1 Tax=Endozoicomonas sp. ONNA1 TaxID=2828740 RepID=UPI002148E28E|nr:hypothetical protein [Endozoicomonas sp. ONNA1]
MLLLSVVCQAQSVTRHFVNEPEHKTSSPDQCFSIKRARHRLPDHPSVIANKTGHRASDLPPDDKPKEPDAYGVKTALVNSITWHWLYADHLLVSFELILIIKDASLYSATYSWQPVEVVFVVAAVWLFKSYRNSGSLLLSPVGQPNPIEQRDANQNYPLATIILMSDSAQNQQQCQPSESSGQFATKATARPSGSLTRFHNTGYSGGSGGPEQDQHTLGLNCFFYPCHGACQFRPSFESGEPTEWPLNSEQSSCPHLANGRCFSCLSQLDSEHTEHPMYTGADFTAYLAGSFNYNAPTPDNEPLSTNESAVTTRSPTFQSFFEEAGISSRPTKTDTPQDPTAPENAVFGTIHCQQSLSDHKIKYDIRLLACNMTVVGKEGRHQPYGMVSKNAQPLSLIERREQNEPKTCDVAVVDGDGQRRLCRTICRSLKALPDHKRRQHTARKTCNVIVAGEDGQKRPCGKICNNTQALSDHKRRHHTDQRTCDVTVVGKDGQPRPCGTVSKSAKSLLDHKRRKHSGQRTCNKIVVGEDSQQRLCGKVCKNPQSLSDHKRIHHSGQQTCDVTMVGENGQQRPCGKICKNTKTLYEHKKRHRKRKPVDVQQYD